MRIHTHFVAEKCFLLDAFSHFFGKLGIAVAVENEAQHCLRIELGIFFVVFLSVVVEEVVSLLLTFGEFVVRIEAADVQIVEIYNIVAFALDIFLIVFVGFAVDIFHSTFQGSLGFIVDLHTLLLQLAESFEDVLCRVLT